MAVREIALKRIEEAKEELVASSDPEYDRVIKGLIIGLREYFEIKPDVTEEVFQDDDQV